MKPTFSFLSAVILSACAVTFIALTATNKKNVVISEPLNGVTENTSERIQWEIARLCDPSTGMIPSYIRQKELAYAATLPNDADGSSVRGMAGLTWLNRGPWNVGGRTRACAIDIANENRIIAGTCSGGMWLSTDGGTSWTMTNTASQLKSATCVVQDVRPNHRNVWYYGSGEGYGASASASGTGGYYQGDGVFKSTDNGVTWQQLMSTSGGNPNSFTTNWQVVWNMAIDISAHDTIQEVYAATIYGIYRSINGGINWTAVRSGNAYYTDVAVDSTGVVYVTQSSDAGPQKGLWRSTNGINYTNITPPGFAAEYKRVVIGINPNNKNEVYFLGNTPNSGKITYDYFGRPVYSSFWKYTYVSGDGSGAGGIWQDLSMNLPSSGGPFDQWNTQNSYDIVVRVKPGSPNTVFIGGT
ncbi:MAG: WD40/YVTN/BNR-like repeat-containing protein, partial [Bacteroidota bacterium]